MRDWAARLVPDCAEPAIGQVTSGRTRWLHRATLFFALRFGPKRRGAVGVGAVRPSDHPGGRLFGVSHHRGFRRPQSERLGCFGVFGYFLLIILGVWLATTVASRFF
jgi:hypothetical protein